MKARALAALLKAAGLKSAGARGRCAGVECDSRRVRRGQLYCALPSASGRHLDSLAYLRQAAARGAAAVVAGPAALRAAKLPASVLALPVRDPAAAYASLCAAWHAFPARRLALSGITGTNGKTTTAFILRGLLDPSGRRSALLGTVGSWVGGRFQPAANTTPPAAELQALFAEAVRKGCRWAVMEASSHALAQARTAGLSFRAAVFTNLTRDHLDYHGTMQAYGRAKARLFAQLAKNGTAVVNAEDPWSKRMAAARTRGSRLLRYHAGGGDAELRAEHLRLEMDGTLLVIEFGGRRLPLRLPIPGRHNVANALAAAGAALAQGLDLAVIAERLEKPGLPPGRFELVRAGQPFNVVVDYAHTPDALERLLKAAREVSPGRLITVFGCGGDRDRGKRPLMGRLGARLSDLSLLTSDNPRSEKPAAILAEVAAGVPRSAAKRVRRILDRRAAIRAALKAARPGDSVLLAGKGHEDYQILGTRKIHFDDREEARAGLRSLGWRARA